MICTGVCTRNAAATGGPTKWSGVNRPCRRLLWTGRGKKLGVAAWSRRGFVACFLCDISERIYLILIGTASGCPVLALNFLSRFLLRSRLCNETACEYRVPSRWGQTGGVVPCSLRFVRFRGQFFLPFFTGGFARSASFFGGPSSVAAGAAIFLGLPRGAAGSSGGGVMYGSTKARQSTTHRRH